MQFFHLEKRDSPHGRGKNMAGRWGVRPVLGRFRERWTKNCAAPVHRDVTGGGSCSLAGWMSVRSGIATAIIFAKAWA